MGMVVTLFLALAAMTVSYAFGQGGPVAGLVFFTVPLRRRPCVALTESAARSGSSPSQARVATTSRYSASSTRVRVLRDVVLLEQRAVGRPSSAALPSWPDPLEGHLGRAEVGAEELEKWSAERKRWREMRSLAPQVGDPVAEQLPQALLGSPERPAGRRPAAAARAWRSS